MSLASIPAVRKLIELALDEDLGRGDITSRVTVGDRGPIVVADMTAREPLVAFGLDIAAAVFQMVDDSITIERVSKDGDRLPGKRAVMMTVRGAANPVLAAERTALNFVQRLSGVATLAKKFADAVGATGTKARVVDTRKTTPGYRVLEKAAVLAGGCANHRFDLGSGVLIKDNHIAACGSVRAAVIAAKAAAPHPLRIECEVTSMKQLDEAIAAGAEIVLLDNMSVDEVRACAARAHEKNIIVEVSGGITLATVAEYAKAGADLISAGALTHSAPSVDIGLDVRT